MTVDSICSSCGKEYFLPSCELDGKFLSKGLKKTVYFINMIIGFLILNKLQYTLTDNQNTSGMNNILSYSALIVGVMSPNIVLTFFLFFFRSRKVRPYAEL